jgi:hypothetical protein
VLFTLVHGIVGAALFTLVHGIVGARRVVSTVVTLTGSSGEVVSVAQAESPAEARSRAAAAERKRIVMMSVS